MQGLHVPTEKGLGVRQIKALTFDHGFFAVYQKTI
jgi:hypothetical protein